jgi:hypothetical protein
MSGRSETNTQGGALESGVYVPVLIGGMARSGTTLLSALISTSNSCNGFAPEPHYLGQLMYAITSMGLPHQECFSTDRHGQLREHFGLFRKGLDEAWRTMDRPSILVLKHVYFTPMCELIGHFLPQAKFLAIMRDPRDIFASLIRAKRKEFGVAFRDINVEKLIPQWVHRFNHYYGCVLRAAANEFRGRLLAIDHDSLCVGDIHRLSDFMELSDIDPRALWRRCIVDIHRYENDPLFSDGWGKPLDKEFAKSHRTDLSYEVAERIQQDTMRIRAEFLTLARGPTLQSFPVETA